MRRFSRQALAAFTLFLCLLAPAFAETVKLTFVQTNDVDRMEERDGRGGFARLMAVVKAERAKLEVRVPAGVDNDMQLCLRGEGEPGENGGPAGDLYVEIRVKAHKMFERLGRDLGCRVPTASRE